MIVKNEAAMITACLDSVTGLVDQIIVVDTGSDDDTVQRARARGANVVHFEWTNDFAAARNAALPYCTCDWILTLDADERILPDDHSRIQAALHNVEIDAYTLPLYNAIDFTTPLIDVPLPGRHSGEPTLLPRLTRRTPDFEWDGMIHEGPHLWSARRAARIRPLRVPIIHLGGIPSVREQRKKSERNISLLEARCKAEPSSPTPLTYLSSEYRAAGRGGEASECAKKAWELLIQQYAGSGAKSSAIETTTLWATHLLERLEIERALHVLATAESWGPRHPNFEYLRGIAEEARAARCTVGPDKAAAFQSALRAFHRCLSFSGQLFHTAKIPGITDAHGHFRLNQCLLLAGAAPEALEGFAEALGTYPDEHHQLRLGLAEAQVRSGAGDAAMATLEPLFAAEMPDVWLVACAAAEALGRLPDMVPLLEQARRKASLGFRNPRYALLLQHLEDAVAIYGLTPHGPRGPLVRFAALMDGLPLLNAGPGPQCFDDLAVGALVTNLVRLGRRDAVVRLLETRAEAMFPGLAMVVRRATSEFEFGELRRRTRSPVIVCGSDSTTVGNLAATLAVQNSFASSQRALFAWNGVVPSRAALAPALRDAWVIEVVPASAPRRHPSVAERTFVCDTADLHADPRAMVRRVLAFVGEPAEEAGADDSPSTRSPDVVNAEDAMSASGPSHTADSNSNGATAC